MLRHAIATRPIYLEPWSEFIELFRLFDDCVAYVTSRQPCFRDIPLVSNLFSCSLPPDFELWTPPTDVTSAATGVAPDAVAPTYQDIRLVTILMMPCSALF